ncbi:MAG: hypothetical protein CMN79_00325 [Spirochaetales bacterium]|nr:hypothetical protein [Spirochaetales bacterium]|tara:strand:+ start:6312 stop:7313 length:1002 start_codon:yes stop_codon:yes gene_type:complete
MDTSLTIVQIVQPLCAILAIWVGSDILVKNSLELGKKLGISELLVGLTFVAWGTSLPEFFVMLNSIFFLGESAATLSYGTILGSNIANISLVLGIGLIASNQIFSSDGRNILSRSLIIMGATLCLVIFPVADSSYKQIISMVMVASMFLYIAASLRDRKGSHIWSRLIFLPRYINKMISKSGEGVPRNVFWLLASSILIYFGSAAIVGSGGNIMNHFGWNATAIGTVFFALSTSFPEIATSLISIVKFQKTSVVVGNVIGSNISNIFLFGIISTVYNLNLTSSIGALGGLLVLAEVLLFGIFILYRKKNQIQIPSFVGIFLTSIYLIFLITIF